MMNAICDQSVHCECKCKIVFVFMTHGATGVDDLHRLRRALLLRRAAPHLADLAPHGRETPSQLSSPPPPPEALIVAMQVHKSLDVKQFMAYM